MGILYALVARGSVVLAEFSATSKNGSAIAKQILDKIPGNSDTHGSYSQDRFILHASKKEADASEEKKDRCTFHVKRTGCITVLCMADDTAGRRLPFAFLEEILQRFVRTYGCKVLSAQAYGMNDEFSKVLRQQMEYYSNGPRINGLEGEMSPVRNVMIENVDRGDRLELAMDKTANMQGSTFGFWNKVGLVAGAAAATAATAVGIWKLVSSYGDDSEEGKTMKAPGRNQRILREVFEDDAAGYFRQLRNDKKAGKAASYY